jgi:hypothetical protein
MYQMPEKNIKIFFAFVVPEKFAHIAEVFGEPAKSW